MASDTQLLVDELLTDLASAIDAEQSTLHRDELDKLAERADELLSSTDLPALAATTGLGDADDPPSSVPAAVATGAPQDVAALRSLLTVAKLSTADDDRADELVSELMSLTETAQLPAAEAAPSDVVDTADRKESDDKKQDDEEPSLHELLQSQLQETLDVFAQLPELEQFSEGLDGGTAEEEPSNGTEDEPAADQSTRSPDGTRWRPGGGTQRTTHSTVPDTGRRDIGRRPGRFSSVRGSTVSKR